MKISRLLSLTLLFPLLCFGMGQQLKTYYPFLSQGFNQQNYQQCSQFIAACPSHGPYPDLTCVKQKLISHAVCQQLQQLADNLGLSATQLSAKKLSNLTVINIVFPADGQQENVIITPDGYLIKTVIDPRQIDAQLAKQYQNKEFQPISEDSLHYKNKGVKQSFTTLIKITDTCIACPVLGWAKIQFDFDKEGKFLQAKLVKFTAGAKKP